MGERTVTFAASDGQRLTATLFEPDAAAGGARAARVLINSATGVRRGYYAAFARFLAARGFAVMTYDYRGIGESRPRRLRGFDAHMHEWGALDQGAAIDHLVGGDSSARLLVVGHSFGGQALALAPNAGRIAAALTVGAQHAYWRHWDPPRRYVLWALWHAVMPGLSHLAGYFPSHLLGLGEDLPKGVALEWARLARNPRAAASLPRLTAADGFAEFDAPIRLLSFTDDHYAPPRAVEALRSLYPNAPTEHRSIDPHTVGRSSIGHFGFFRERVGGELWPAHAEWLASH
jgi:predicted alpha/beta hydrolase